MLTVKPEVKKINVLSENCPVPLVETRKAIRKASPGDLIEVVGDHPSSKKEIPMAVEEMGLELLSVEETDDKWIIRIRVSKEGSESNG
ncbi:MAG: sulfurtransferase TusA family protein [Candidatus Korarchaeota archaeon]|nr:sulfurtransferase TusA family protein [Candidatus Korarchaeota archaeon]NIU83427.1 sulfurtransferase TusA family protein [Candidatus Thorarchaeota archaeon]NIW13699.1 sulfurtransferase TusA family protein [Candidatus Thorarchaeota archaeon]NIW51798.1 sulfurtransferase TusA family protein [Candidatus Korarchaeota archaeon]